MTDEPLDTGQTLDEPLITPEEMAERLAPVHPLRHVMFRPKEAIPLRPKGERANFRVVNDSLAALIAKLGDVTAQAREIERKLTGASHHGGKAVEPDKQPPNEDQSIFDHLAYQALVLARLVGELEMALKASEDALQ
jgi:hypothetical protein